VLVHRAGLLLVEQPERMRAQLHRDVFGGRHAVTSSFSASVSLSARSA
jgi:hypothetical protein